MINAEELFAALTHDALRRKQIFGRGLVSDERIWRDVPEWINRLSISQIAANQSAAFARGFTARVLNDLASMGALKKNFHDRQGSMSSPSDVRKAPAFPRRVTKFNEAPPCNRGVAQQDSLVPARKGGAFPSIGAAEPRRQYR